MIGKLKGIIDSIEEDTLLLDVNGVGYMIFASAATLRNMGHMGDAATLYIETHVREDHFHLFGFATQEEKRAFLLLNKVSGVGAKMALAVLSTLTPPQLATAIASQDAGAFKAVSGVGPKLATRITTELKDKFSVLGVESFSAATPVSTTETNASPSADAASALVNLGYNRSDAYTAVMRVASTIENPTVSELVRLGLKELGTVNA